MLPKIILGGLEIVHHIQGYTKEVANVAKAMWHSRVQRFIESKIWLNELGAAANQRLPAFLPQVGKSYVAIEGKRKNPY